MYTEYSSCKFDPPRLFKIWIRPRQCIGRWKIGCTSPICHDNAYLKSCSKRKRKYWVLERNLKFKMTSDRHNPIQNWITMSVLGLGISDKKIIPRKTELTEQMVISDGIPAVLRNRISRKRKHLGIPFRGTEIEANSRNSIPKPSAEDKQLGIPFRGTEIEANSQHSLPNLSAEEKTTRNSVPNHFRQYSYWKFL
jgi:hypothetical protein